MYVKGFISQSSVASMIMHHDPIKNNYDECLYSMGAQPLKCIPPIQILCLKEIHRLLVL